MEQDIHDGYIDYSRMTPGMSHYIEWLWDTIAVQIEAELTFRIR